MSRRALITGITGMDASYLAELLLDKNYEVYGLHTQRATPNTRNIDHLLDRIKLVKGDMCDHSSLETAIQASDPDEIYNLAAQSFVHTSWEMPEMTGNVNGLGVVRLLEAARKFAPHARIYQASTSELFGKVHETPQRETTPFHPRSPYGVAKLYGHWAAVNHRESYNLFVCCGILFNHTSPRRGEQFVCRKIARGAARIARGLDDKLVLGDLRPRRDLGHAKDFVRAMWSMLQQEEPDDYVIATGETHTIQEMVEVCFEIVGLDWTKHVVQDPKLIRPAEVDLLLGDPTKARTKLGWTREYDFRSIFEEMVSSELKA